MSKLRFAILPLLVVACSGDNNPSDAGADASKDATTTDASKDVTSKDVTTQDATSDVKLDVASDVTGDTPSDAPADSSSDGGPTDAQAEAGSSWHMPTCDGTIGSGEYGPAQNQTTSSSQNWYVTWDATNLYVALDNANLAEANVIYVGFSGGGLTTAQVYDYTGGTLPFAADGVVYAKSGYQEARKGSADAGAWSNPVTNAVTFCGSGTTREEVIPWTALGSSSIPSSFRFLAYATSSGGYIYGQIPTTNPTADAGTSATFPHDFYVSSTSNGTGSFPFDVTE